MLDRGFDLRDGEVGLCRWIVAANQTIRAGGGGAGDQDAVADAHGTPVTGECFPGCAAVVGLSLQFG